jgi:2-keto-4-pentenoate hydratase
MRPEDVARLLWASWSAGALVGEESFTDATWTEADGHEAQASFEGFAGGRIGWKVGGNYVGDGMPVKLGAPVLGRLFAGCQVEAGSELPLRESDTYVEAELAFCLNERASQLDGATASELFGAIDAIHLAVEIPASRFSEIGQLTLGLVLADNAFVDRFILGPRIRVDEAERLADIEATVYVDDRPVAAGGTWNVAGGPLGSLGWLAAALKEIGESLDAGDVVLTGTLTRPYAVTASARVRVEWGDCGSVDATFIRETDIANSRTT